MAVKFYPLIFFSYFLLRLLENVRKEGEEASVYYTIGAHDLEEEEEWRTGDKALCTPHQI